MTRAWRNTGAIDAILARLARLARKWHALSRLATRALSAQYPRIIRASSGQEPGIICFIRALSGHCPGKIGVPPGRYPVVTRSLPGLKLSKRQWQGVRHAARQGRLTREEYEKETGAARATAHRDLVGLVKKGVLAPAGVGRSAWYRLSVSTGETKCETKTRPETKGKMLRETKPETQLGRNVSRKWSET